MEQLENYLKQEDREIGLQSLIGEKKLEAQILNELQKYQSSNQEMILLIDQMIQQFKTQYGETQGYKQLAYKFLLKKLENEQDQKIQEEIIEQLEKIFEINYPAQSFLQQVKDYQKNEYQIDEKILELERFQELVEKEQQNFDDFNLLYMSQLNPQILKDKKFIGWFKNKGFQIIPFLGDDFNLFEILLQDENHSDSLIKEFEDRKMQIICSMHTQKQIESALQKFPDLYKNTELVLILINKKIKKQNPTDEELLQILNLIIDWICNQVPEKYQVTRSNLRFFFMVQLYNLKMKMNQQITLKEMIQLLKIKQVCVQEESITMFQRIKSSQFLGNKNDEQEIIKKLISNWFQSQECKDIGELDSYIDAVTLQKQFDQEKVRIGSDQKYKTLGVQEVEKIQSEQFLDFDKSKNLNKFLPQDQVNLHLRVKNILKLNIKIYEVDQELLFHKGQTLENAKLVNLDGMIPQIQFQQEVIKKYGVMQDVQVNIEQLQNRIGAFIVEIQGDRLQARLEIKKGSLYLIQKQTVSGHLCYVYNEVGIKLQQAGIWVQDRFFKSDEGGKILIPYKQGGQELRSILLTGDNRMEILKFYHQSEDYKMQCAFLINEEQMIAGVDSDILLVPKLIINNQNASLKILEDIEVTILSLDEKEKSSQKTYQQLQIDSQGIIKLQYQVPAKLKEIKIQLRTKVTKVGEQEPLKLECEQTHKFKDINRFLFFDVYLRKSLDVIDEVENQSHYLQILGMNGEPKKQVEVLVSLQF